MRKQERASTDVSTGGQPPRMVRDGTALTAATPSAAASHTATLTAAHTAETSHRTQHSSKTHTAAPSSNGGTHHRHERQPHTAIAPAEHEAASTDTTAASKRRA